MNKVFFIIIFTLIITVLYIKETISNLSIGNINLQQKNLYFGQTLDLEYNQLSIQYFKGFELAFQSVNRKGGINGYNLNIVLLNDKYEKNLAVSNANLLVDYYNVLALIGTFGTPTTVGILENVVDKKNIGLIGPFSGSGLIRSTFNKNLILTSGSLLAEFDLMFKIIEKNNIKNIGIIYQNDDYGQSYLNGFINSILNHKIQVNIQSIANYERNSTFLYNTYKNLFEINKPFVIDPDKKKVNEIQAVILFVAEQQLSNILPSLKKINPSLYIFYNFFAGNDKSNYKIIKNNTENIYQTLLSYDLKVKFPQLYIKLIEEVNYYNQFTHTYEYKNIHKIDYFSNTFYQGFYTGLLIIEVLKKFKTLNNLTRMEFIDKFYEIKNFDIFGLRIGPFINNVNNQGINYVSINKIVDENLELIMEIDYNIKNSKSEEEDSVKIKQENIKIKN